jgi:Xaa-Pro aminopeptidase
MVLAVEPTVFSEEIGGVNIEDMVLVTEHGVEVLSQCPRRLW